MDAQARKAEIQRQALQNAVTGQSSMNYEAIIKGFEAKGIPLADIKPRENVFTFNAWKAVGRVVRKGEKGVPVLTWIPIQKLDEETGEVVSSRRSKTTTVFHISQTEGLQ